MAIATTDPRTGEVQRTFDPLTADGIDALLRRAVGARSAQRAAGFAERAEWMNAAADLLEQDVDELARVMTLEMGKTLASARAEVVKSAKGCRFYAEHAERMMATRSLDSAAVGAVRAGVRYEPIGVVLAVMPWNFPVWQVLRFAAPALMAGNVGVLKHASNVPQTALYLGELFERAGFAAGAFQTALVGAGEVAGIVEDDRVAAATLTGSEAAGRSLAAAAGGALKKTVLELGGSDPFLVLPSANLDEAARTAAAARCQNNGQSCIAAKRFIVHADVYEEFAERFVHEMRGLVLGDPMADGTDVGPLATAQGRAEVHELVENARAAGAAILLGGTLPEGPGWYYPPTVVAEVDRGMRLFAEEAFGPVATLYRADSLDDALKVANGTAFGLGATVWTTCEDEKQRCVEDLEAGCVTVNGMTVSFPELPFGGTKTSGYGRELASEGLLEFCNTKTVRVVS